MARKLIVLIAVLVPLTFAACGGDDDDDTAADTTAAEETTTDTAADTGGGGGGGETVTISETDFALDPSEVSVAAGEVTFDVVNDGQTLHNLEVEGNGVEEVSDDINPGESTQLSVDLSAGEYVMYCAIGNHRELGMEGTVTVE